MSKAIRTGLIVSCGLAALLGVGAMCLAQAPADNPYRPVRGLADGGGPTVPGGEWAKLPGGREMGPPHGLQGRGWSRTTMKLGDEVEVDGTLAKNGSHRGNARTVTMVSTGKRLGAASSEGETP